jgi:hypothetical protein
MFYGEQNKQAIKLNWFCQGKGATSITQNKKARQEK